ncbi:MAG: hypothetical protein J7K46_01435 [Bacteroidales bacterium]|nr:hypothetical protein [Bacteroidales bacterium]
MSDYEKKDFYYDFYVQSKLTKEEIRRVPGFEKLSDDEAEKLSDKIFDLAILAQKIIIEK